jgi:predicted dehydrogenase
MTTKYKLGGIGAGGHWYGRLHEFLKERVELHKAVGITRFEDKHEILESYGLTKDRYFQVVVGASLPDAFFEGIDVIHIASHNQFHEQQTRECLEHEKAVVVEKTLAISEEATENLLRFVRNGGHEGRVTPHVHYLDKALTLDWKNELWPRALKEAGRLVRATATFIEDVSEEDIRRQWLFKPENGGIFMDWIHPSAMLAHVAGAHFEECLAATGYVVNAAYDPANPTGVEARFALRGKDLAPGCTATIRVGKGFPPGVRFKRMRLEFERGAALDLAFLDTEREIETGQKGTWTFDVDGEVEKGRATGPSSYELLVDEMLMMLEGKGAPLSIDEIREIFRPVWITLAALKEQEVVRDSDAIESMMKRAIGLVH